jgi:transcriptional regulator with XRE-family HTH domain
MAKLLLAQTLKRKGMSKRKFAKLLGMKYGNVFRLFHKEYDPKFSTLIAWSKALGVKISDLYSE